jgi:predicted amidohydrolase YtcJ
VLIGRGCDPNAWTQAPDRAALDAVTRGIPALIHTKDFHALWVNSAACERAGVGRDTPDPPDGRFERDAAGEPSGLVREHAVRAFRAVEAEGSDGDDARRVDDALRALHAEGVTSIHDFEGPEARRLLRAALRGDGARMRVLMHLPQASLEAALAIGLESGEGDDWFRIGAVKLFADGTLGSQTAAVLEPYDGTASCGMELIAPDALRELVASAARGGLQCAIHAIGDRAVRASLDAFEHASTSAAALALVPRIEHVQLLHADDRPRFSALGVAASLQPSHAIADIDLVRRHWRTREGRTYPWRSLLASGVRVAFGSDAPVEAPSVALGLHAAVARRRVDGTPTEGFSPGEALDLDQALTAYTEGAARIAGAWPRVGRLVAGAHADLVVWSDDLHRLPTESLHRVRPVATVLAGETVYAAEFASAQVR